MNAPASVKKAGILLAFASFFALAGVSWAAEDGGVVSPFSLGLSARALGLGGAVGSLSDDLGASLDNPALLSTARRQEVATLHASLFVDTAYDALAYGRPTARGSFLIGAFRLSTQGVPLTTTSIDPQGTFAVQQWQGLLSYGLVVRGGLGAGAAVALDAGLVFRPGNGNPGKGLLSPGRFALGLGIGDLVQPEFRLKTDISRTARTFKPSLAWRYAAKGGFSALVGLEGEYTRSSGRVKAGVEAGFKRMFFLRAGHDGDAPTFGAGLRMRGLGVDWALARRDLGASHRFSLLYRFGTLKDPRSAVRAQTLKWIARSYGELERYPEALQAWDKVLDEFPDDPEAPGAKNDLVKKRRKALDNLLKDVGDALAHNDMLRAVPAFNKALGMDPLDPAVQAMARKMDEKTLLSQSYLVGLEAYHRDDYKTAMEAFDVVYRRDPRYRDVARLWSDAKGRFAPLEGMTGELSKLYGRGVAEFLKGRYDKAIDIWKQVLDKDPKNFLVQRNIAEAQARMNESNAPAGAASPKGTPP